MNFSSSRQMQRQAPRVDLSTRLSSLGRIALFLGAVAAVAVLISTAGEAHATPAPWSQEATYLSNPFPALVNRKDTDPAGYANRFGASLAAAGKTLVVGVGEEQVSTPANGGPDPYAHPERIVVFERVADAWDGGTLLQAPSQYRPPAGCAGGAGYDDCYEFGRAVAIDPVDGDTIAVGAPAEVVAGADTKAKHGAVYVFQRTDAGWSFLTRIISPNPNPNDRFGASVSIYGDVIVVGAAGDRATADPSVLNGAAYVFTRSSGSWGATPVATLRSPDISPGATFGQRVAIWGNTIAVGDRAKDDVQVFTGSGANWALEATIPGIFGQSGHGLALRGDFLASGSEFLGDFPAKGEAFLVKRVGSNWGTPYALSTALVPAGVSKPAWFGGSVALGEGIVAVGTGRGVGAVELFDVTLDGSPTHVQSLSVPVASTWNSRQFGKSITIAGPHLLAGAPWDCNTSGSDCTEAQIYQEGSVFSFINPTLMVGPPSPPRDIIVTPDIYSLRVSWRAPTDDGGSPVLRYRAFSNPSCEVEAIPGVEEYSCVIEGLDPATNYEVRVIAINAIGEADAIAGDDGDDTTPPVTFRVLEAMPVPFPGYLNMILVFIVLALVRWRGALRF